MKDREGFLLDQNYKASGKQDVLRDAATKGDLVDTPLRCGDLHETEGLPSTILSSIERPAGPGHMLARLCEALDLPAATATPSGMGTELMVGIEEREESLEQKAKTKKPKRNKKKDRDEATQALNTFVADIPPPVQNLIGTLAEPAPLPAQTSDHQAMAVPWFPSRQTSLQALPQH